MKYNRETKEVSFRYPIDSGNENFNPDHEFELHTINFRGEPYPKTSSYGVGLLTTEAKELHITPVSSIYAMKPTLEHVDKSVEAGDVQTLEGQSKPPAAAAAAATGEGEGAPEGPEVALEYLPATDASSVSLSSRLCSNVTDQCAPPLNGLVYRNRLTPQSKADRAVSYTVPVPQVSRVRFPHLPLRDQLGFILSKLRVARFQQIRALIPPTRQTHDILAQLPSVARVVSGNWVVVSQGNVPEDLVPFRDYLLLKLHSSGAVMRSAFTDETSLPAHLVRDLLVEVCQKVRSRGWALKLPPDLSFLNRHPDVAKEEHKRWEIDSQPILTAVRDAMLDLRLKRREEKGLVPILTPLTANEKSAIASAQQRHSPGAERGDGAAGLQLDRVMAQLSKALKGTEIVDPELPSAAAFSRTPREIPPALAAHANDLSEIVLRHLERHAALEKDLKLEMRKHVAALGPAHPLRRLREDDPQAYADLLTCVLDKASLSLRGLRYLRSVGEPKLDQYRHAVAELFRHAVSWQSLAVKERLKKKFSAPPEHGLYIKAMREFADNHGRVWTLKYSLTK
eukprot:gnl/Chilomastix_cuspidata/2946.p2 GENE.gnl/Chilomastix_cuspidata/2946~~gnl/Chilomastix_cuspidata/2946.p2  ORF type:complete len:630 (-),score=313.13 gnl/Chilomastix_cuspidata/2946:402-2099(-)